MAKEATSPADLRAQLVDATQKKVDDETNSKREGKGTRIRVGQTRGKNPQVIQYEVFDTSKQDSLPESLKEFVEITKSDEKTLLGYLIDGFNSDSYSVASDPIAEFIDASWPDDVQKGFRTSVRAMVSAGIAESNEEAAQLVSTQIAKRLAKK